MANQVYDPQADERRTPTPDLGPSHDRPSGRRSGPSSDNEPAGDPFDPRGDLLDQEKGGDSQSQGSGSSTGGKNFRYNAGGDDDNSTPSTGDVKNREESAGGGFAGDNFNSSSTSKRKVRFSRRQKIFAGVGSTTLVGVVVMFFSITPGPLQFIHFAQFLQKAHFRSNEDFGDTRTSRVLLYALGEGENSRLGRSGNRAADIWEKKLLKDTGLKPVYSATTRRFVGFAIVDEDKAFSTLLDNSDKNQKTTKNLERVMGNGAEIITVGEASAGRQDVVLGKGGILDGKTRMINLRGVSFQDRRIFIRTIGRFTNTYRLASTMGSRLLIKRAGVDFHPLHNLRRGKDNFADFINKRRQERAKQNRTGVETRSPVHDTTTGQNGKPVETAPTAAATDEAGAAIKEAADTPGKGKIKEVVGKLSKNGAFGVLCAAKAFGSDIQKFKYAQNALPMIRMGMGVVTKGNQVMSNQDTSTDELGADSKSFYNQDDHTSWTDGRSVQAELGQIQTGPDIPPEAQLKNINKKPRFFNTLDKAPLLGTSCTIANAASGLPIIGDLISVGYGAITSMLDGIASIFGTSTEAIMTGALAAASGQSVDTLATGAEFGNLANTGAFLAANDNAVAMGGAQLSAATAATLKSDEKLADAQDNSTKSFADRYLNPSDGQTLVGALIDRAPASSSQVASLANGVPNLLSSSLHSLATVFVPKAAAATPGYDYGVPKFGFSPTETYDSRFEDPYQNAAIIEQPGVLDSLNEKYGKACFGMTVTTDDNGVHVQSESMGSDDLNVFKVTDKNECNPSKNGDEMFLRYRFYLADAVTAESADCYEGSSPASDQSCTDLGFSSPTADAGSSSSAATSTGTLPSGSAKDLASQLLPYVKDNKISCNGGQGKDCPDIQNTAKGTSTKVGSCYVDSLTPNLLGLLLYLAQQNHTFILSAICSDHPTNPKSQHHVGEAADFNYIDGVYMGEGEDAAGTVPWTATKIAAAKSLDQDAASVLPKSSQFGQFQCGASDFAFLAGFSVIVDGCHHQHIGVGK